MPIRPARFVPALALGLLALPTAALHAETVLVGDQLQVVPSTIARPFRGASMSAVEAQFGAPQNRHPTVGTPPITRWDYAGFSVFFEHDRVVDAVATGN